MPNPELLLGDTAREHLKQGFDILARLLAITLGPTPRTILTTSYQRALPEALEDAATIARRMVGLPNRAQSAGALLLRHLVWRQSQRVGDGCAIAAVLAQALLAETHRMLVAGVSLLALKAGVEQAVAIAIDALRSAARPLVYEDEIHGFAHSICAHERLSDLIAELFDLLGPDAAITVERFAAPYLEREYVEGGRWKARLASAYFAQSGAEAAPSWPARVVMRDPAVVIFNGELRELDDVLPVLELAVAAQYQQLLLIVRHIEDPALTALVTNHQRNQLRIAVVELRETGERCDRDFEDLAALTGAALIDPGAGERLRFLTAGQIGRARRVEASAELLSVAGWHAGATIRSRIAALQKRQQVLSEQGESEAVQELRMRIGRLSTGSAILKIGAHSEIERELLDRRAEQCLRALPIALRQGVLPGGGVAYLDVIPQLEALPKHGEQAYGVQAVIRALQAPLCQIVANAGLRDPAAVLAEVRRMGSGWGYDALRDEICQLAECRILDSAAVLIEALRMAASGAIMALTTEALVLKRNPETSFEP